VGCSSCIQAKKPSAPTELGSGGLRTHTLVRRSCQPPWAIPRSRPGDSAPGGVGHVDQICPFGLGVSDCLCRGVPCGDRNWGAQGEAPELDRDTTLAWYHFLLPRWDIPREDANDDSATCDCQLIKSRPRLDYGISRTRDLNNIIPTATFDDLETSTTSTVVNSIIPGPAINEFSAGAGVDRIITISAKDTISPIPSSYQIITKAAINGVVTIAYSSNSVVP
jgi:hypothetical protein